MKIQTTRRLAALFLALALPATFIFAGDPPSEPRPRDPNWVKRHKLFVEIADDQTDCKVMFLGDSITDGWRNAGLGVWDKNFARYNPVNFGISGDRTEHLLWRLQNGEIGNLKPKAIVMMIGTNNTGLESDKKTPRNQPPEIAGGIKTIITYLQEKIPNAKILLLAVFPRGEKDDLQRKQVNEVNLIISKYHDGKRVFYLDINQKFLEADGTLPRDIMPDLLHPNLKGYKIWADAIREPLAKLAK